MAVSSLCDGTRQNNRDMESSRDNDINNIPPQSHVYNNKRTPFYIPNQMYSPRLGQTHRHGTYESIPSNMATGREPTIKDHYFSPSMMGGMDRDMGGYKSYNHNAVLSDLMRTAVSSQNSKAESMGTPKTIASMGSMPKNAMGSWSENTPVYGNNMEQYSRSMFESSDMQGSMSVPQPEMPCVSATTQRDTAHSSDMKNMSLDCMNSLVERWYIKDVQMNVSEAVVVSTILRAIHSMDARARPILLSTIKNYSGESVDYYIIVRVQATTTHMTVGVRLGMHQTSASKVENISNLVPHLTADTTPTSSNTIDGSRYLKANEILAGYFLESLCLGCDTIGHTQPNCVTSNFMCPNCKSSTHSGSQCNKVCRFCETLHPGRSIMVCVRQVAQFHRSHGNAPKIIESVNNTIRKWASETTRATKESQSTTESHINSENTKSALYVADEKFVENEISPFDDDKLAPLLVSGIPKLAPNSRIIALFKKKMHDLVDSTNNTCCQQENDIVVKLVRSGDDRCATPIREDQGILFVNNEYKDMLIELAELNEIGCCMRVARLESE